MKWNEKMDKKAFRVIETFIIALTEQGVICTTSEEEKYTYCMCFLKTIHDVGILNTDDANRISQLFKELCLDKLVDEDEIIFFIL